MARPRSKPTEAQASGLIAEMIGLLHDQAADAEEMLRRAGSGGSAKGALGWPGASSGAGGGGRGSSEMTPTERAADRFFPRVAENVEAPEGSKERWEVIGNPVGLGADPQRTDVLTWARCVQEAYESISRAERCRKQVMEGEQDGEGPGRVNTVEVCVECSEPAPKVKRLDGAAYHAPVPGGPQCWWHAYRRRQSGGAASVELPAERLAA